MSERDHHDREDIFSKAVRAGKRTYFFDVKATRGNDYYLTITESKKMFEDEKPVFRKHKLFLYKEDFEKFTEGLKEAVDFIHQEQGEEPPRVYEERQPPAVSEATEEAPKPPAPASPADPDDKFTDINFDDLGGDSDASKS